MSKELLQNTVIVEKLVTVISNKKKLRNKWAKNPESEYKWAKNPEGKEPLLRIRFEGWVFFGEHGEGDFVVQEGLVVRACDDLCRLSGVAVHCEEILSLSKPDLRDHLCMFLAQVLLQLLLETLLGELLGQLPDTHEKSTVRFFGD